MTPEEAIKAMEAAWEPARSPDQPPPFLRADQIDPWRRTRASLTMFGGALLAERVGSGKTWIALGVAISERTPPVAIVPAIVLAQWERTARAAGCRLHCWTHERASRGAVPRQDPSLVIIDEAHRFRDPSTRRVKSIAPWLVGRRVLLLTATPIVNRITDLVTLLHLAVAEDALRLDGVPSLSRIREMKQPPPALRRVVIRSPPPIAPGASRRTVPLAADQAECGRTSTAVSAILSLSLSPAPGIRRLLRGVFLDAAASSEAAFRAVLTRYRALLLQSRDAGGTTRAALRHFAGVALDQLVMWEIIGVDTQSVEIPLEDLPRIETLLASRTERDEWIHRLLARCQDSTPTVCFARHRETARAVVTVAREGTAWVRGASAGIGPHRLPRDLVLAAFGPERAEWRARRTAPRILVTTDVAAEGLNLQSAGRMVHLDLPWTATRLEQREGRLLRIGQMHEEVEVLVRAPAPPVEEALRLARLVQKKATLAEEWLRGCETRESVLPRSGPPLLSTTNDSTAGDIVAIELSAGLRRGVMLLSGRDGEWQVTLQALDSLSARPDSGPGSTLPCSPTPTALLEEAARAAIQLAEPMPVGACQTLIRRLHDMARRAARAHDATALRRLDGHLRFVAASHTLGEQLLLDQLATMAEPALLALRCPSRTPPPPVSARPVAALLFRSTGATLR